MPLSTQQIIEALSRNGADPWLALLTLEHPQLNGGVPVRLARNPTEDIISNGTTFTKSWFEIELPSDVEQPTTCRISIMNIDGAIGRVLEDITGPIECEVRIVLASDPDTYGREFLRFELRDTSWDALSATGTLSQATITNNRWPKYQVTPKFFSHLFP